MVISAHTTTLVISLNQVLKLKTVVFTHFSVGLVPAGTRLVSYRSASGPEGAKHISPGQR